MFSLEKNSRFSKMTISDRQELLNYLSNYYIEYKDSLNLNKDMTFGMEIECYIPGFVSYKNGYKKHTNFNLEKEPSVVPDGWEFQSPILHDTNEDWNEVKRTCDYLKSFCFINDFCGGHIHFGAHVFEDKLDYLMNFIFLWMAFEDIIYRFGNGEFLNTRKGAKDYAAPAFGRFKDIFEMYGFPKNTKQFLRSFKNPIQDLGLNLFHYTVFFNHMVPDKDTIEFRNPNGSLEEVIWQNNINFYGKLIQCALNDDLDISKLDYYINHFDYNDDTLYQKINLDKALDLADLIFDNNREKLDFLKQYVKDGEETSSKKLVKASKFWK